MVEKSCAVGAALPSLLLEALIWPAAELCNLQPDRLSKLEGPL